MSREPPITLPHRVRGKRPPSSKDEGVVTLFINSRPQFYFRTTDVTGHLPEGTEMVTPGDTEMTVTLIQCEIAMEEASASLSQRYAPLGRVTKIIKYCCKFTTIRYIFSLERKLHQVSDIGRPRICGVLSLSLNPREASAVWIFYGGTHTRQSGYGS